MLRKLVIGKRRLCHPHSVPRMPFISLLLYSSAKLNHIFYGDVLCFFGKVPEEDLDGGSLKKKVSEE